MQRQNMGLFVWNEFLFYNYLFAVTICFKKTHFIYGDGGLSDNCKAQLAQALHNRVEGEDNRANA
jgi:hypothetical protein